MPAEPKSKRVSVNGLTLHYWDWESNGPTLIMLHQSSGFGRVWDWVAQELHPDYRILALDQRGHGDSDKPAGGYSGQDYASDLEGFMDALGIQRCVLVGNSLGVRVGIIYTAQHPERVSHLVLVGGPHYAFLFEGEDLDWWKNRAQEMRTGPRRFPSAAEAMQALHAARPSFSQEALEHVIRYNMNHYPDGSVEWKYDPVHVAEGLEHVPDNLVPYITQLTCPILALRAEKSWELTPERMPKVEALFPTARWVTITGAVYTLQLEKPREVAQAIRDFLAATGEV